MVFELLGPNLEDLFQYCDGRFSLKTTLMLTDQLLRRIEDLHAVRYLHRDIKPENFLLGTGRQGNVVFMTDFGLASYRRIDHGQPTFREQVGPPRLSLVGTCRYASINGHLAVGKLMILCYTCLTRLKFFYVGPSRRDDLESLGYMALYFLRGSLPWQGIKAPSQQEKHRLVLERKQATPVAELCDGLPPEFATYVEYIRGLSVHDKPDYKHLRNLFDRLFRREGFEHDNVFDWTIREFERLSHSNQPQLVSDDNDLELNNLKDLSASAKRRGKGARREKSK